MNGAGISPNPRRVHFNLTPGNPGEKTGSPTKASPISTPVTMSNKNAVVRDAQLRQALNVTSQPTIVHDNLSHEDVQRRFKQGNNPTDAILVKTRRENRPTECALYVKSPMVDGRSSVRKYALIPEQANKGKFKAHISASQDPISINTSTADTMKTSIHTLVNHDPVWRY